MTKKRSVISRYWKQVVVFLLVVCLGIVVFFAGLSTTPPGVSFAELEFINQSSSLSKIIDNPINAPLKLPILLLHKLDINRLDAFRALSGIFSVVTVILFYRYLRARITRRLSIMTTVLLITSSWMLHVTRLALPIVLLPFGVMLVLAVLDRKDKIKPKLTLVLAGILFGLLAYIPGMLFILFTALLLGRDKKDKDNKVKPRYISGFFGIILFLAICAPLISAVWSGNISIESVLGLPNLIEPIEWIKRLLITPVYIFARGPFEPIVNLNRIPILDVFSSALLILGIYANYFTFKTKSTQRVATITVTSLILIALNGVLFMSLLIPLVFIVMSAGLALLLQQWFTVFPNNPIARNLGVFILVASILLVSGYHARRYFVAWQKSPITHSVFQTESKL